MYIIYVIPARIEKSIRNAAALQDSCIVCGACDVIIMLMLLLLLLLLLLLALLIRDDNNSISY